MRQCNRSRISRPADRVPDKELSGELAPAVSLCPAGDYVSQLQATGGWRNRMARHPKFTGCVAFAVCLTASLTVVGAFILAGLYFAGYFGNIGDTADDRYGRRAGGALPVFAGDDEALRLRPLLYRDNKIFRHQDSYQLHTEGRRILYLDPVQVAWTESRSQRKICRLVHVAQFTRHTRVLNRLASDTHPAILLGVLYNMAADRETHSRAVCTIASGPCGRSRVVALATGKYMQMYGETLPADTRRYLLGRLPAEVIFRYRLADS